MRSVLNPALFDRIKPDTSLKWHELLHERDTTKRNPDLTSEGSSIYGDMNLCEPPAKEVDVCAVYWSRVLPRSDPLAKVVLRQRLVRESGVRVCDVLEAMTGCGTGWDNPRYELSVRDSGVHLREESVWM